MKYLFALVGLLCGFIYSGAQVKLQKADIVVFSPVIEPDISEIQQSTWNIFFEAWDRNPLKIQNKYYRITQPAVQDSETIRAYCENNQADYAVVPKVTYFKVGIGKYVFSSQVTVELSLYDKNGQLLLHNSYNTFKKHARVLGSTVNSLKIGVKGAVKAMNRSLNCLPQESFQN